MSEYSDDLNLLFSFEKSFNSLKASSEIPSIFEEVVKNDPGHWVWGVGSNSDIDIQGERVVLKDDVARTLEQAPYNKLLLEHDMEGKNVGGISSMGIIKFSRIVPEMDNQHIILAKLNDSHQRFPNIWGSIQSGNIDSFSVAGSAPKENVYNPKTGQHEVVRTVQRLKETSLTSLPANAGAGILGAFIKKSLHNSDFFMPLKGHGGVEFFKNKENTMTNENQEFVSMETYQKDMGELKGLVQKAVEMQDKQTDAIKSMHNGHKELLKTLSEEDDNTKKNDESSEEDTPTDAPKEEPAADETQKVAEKSDAKEDVVEQMKKKMEEMDDKLQSFQKNISQRVGVSNTGRPDDVLQKNSINQGPSEMALTGLLGSR